MSQPSPAPYTGPVFLSLGFRPFFLLAVAYATLAIPLWIEIFFGRVELGGPFSPVDWHVHEMVFGFTGAVICGFLLTAIPNWTGRAPLRGMRLLGLAVIWLAGRLAVAGVWDLSPDLVMVVDVSFMLLVAGISLFEVVQGRNWRNLIVVVPLLIFAVSNFIFHLEAQVEGEADVARRISFSVIIFLIAVIGGRIVPLFTGNWLKKQLPPDQLGPMPVTFNRLDMVFLAVSVVAMSAWCVGEEAAATQVLLLAAAVCHAYRMTRWQGLRVLASPLLFMLHVAYVFVPLGFLLLGLGEQSAGLHIWGVGAIGGMTLAVMVRASLGHSGRPLEVGPALTAAFVNVVLAAVLRSAMPYDEVFGLTGIEISALLWGIGFAIVLLRIVPWCVLPRADGK